MAESTEVVPAEKPQQAVVTIKAFLAQNVKSIEAALPNVGLTAESITRTALSQIYRNPVLETCDRTSLMRAIIEAASLGLSFALGRGYLVPFNNKRRDPVTGRESWRMEAQFMPGYQGLVDLVRRSANVKTVLARAVYQGDEFAYEFGLETDVFHHKPLIEPDDKLLTHAYCLIRFLDGGYQLVVLTKLEIDAVRKRSKAADNGPWVTDYASMAIKTAVKRDTKLCPASIELARAIQLDDDAEIGRPQQLESGPSLLGESEQPQLTAAPEPPVSVTQQVSQKAAETLKAVRPEFVPEVEKAVEAVEKAVTEPTEKVGAGRPPKCPGLDPNGCEKKANLKSAVEREFKLCDFCRVKRDETIRKSNGTHPEVVADVQPIDATAPVPEEVKLGEKWSKSDAVGKLAMRCRANFMIEANNSLSRAELALSELSNGKVQKFEDLAEYLANNPDFIIKVQEAMK